jgi:hypothetical protein
MTGQKVTLVGGPAAGEQLTLTNRPEVLRVPTYLDPRVPLARFDYPGAGRRVAWYRREVRNPSRYTFDRFED